MRVKWIIYNKIEEPNKYIYTYLAYNENRERNHMIPFPV